MTTKAFTLIGRSSSSFTRIARLFAAELGISYAFDGVLDLKSLDTQDYGGNPALKVPSLRTPARFACPSQGPPLLLETRTTLIISDS